MISCVMLTSYPKRAAMMRQAVQSFCLQTYPDRELVIVNDGEGMFATALNVKVVNTWPGQSIGAKRNLGARAAAGEWLATWDDDDFSLPERLTALHALAASTGARYVSCDRMWLADKELRVLGVATGASYPTSIVNRSLYLDVGGCPDISYLEDMELYIRLKMRGIRASYLPMAVYVHRRHDLNVSNQHGESFEKHAERIDPRGAEAITRRVQELLSLPCPELVRPA